MVRQKRRIQRRVPRRVPANRSSMPDLPIEDVPVAPRASFVAVGYGLALVLFSVGQYLFLKRGDALGGISISAAGLILAFALQAGWLNQMLMPRRVDPTPIPVQPKTSKDQPVRSRAALPPMSPPTPALWASWFRPATFLRIVLLFLSGMAAMQGQEFLSNVGRLPMDGLKYYFVSVLLFIVALAPAQREDLKDAPLSRRFELAVFLGIFILGAFLRTWRLDQIPSGVFIDMGFQGLGGLRILYEHWVPPLHVGETLQAPSLVLWQKALWWAFIPKSMVGQTTLYLFYALLSLASFPLIYWTFRQLSGPRIALLSLFILSVMRWNINFSRNAFPPIEMPLYMFGTTAFLLYGLRTRKAWSFLVAAVFFAGGLYTYQAYKAFPAFVLLVGLYEMFFNFKEFKPNLLRILLFAGLSFALMWPVVSYWRQQGSLGMRENQLSMYARCQQAGSIQPFLENLQITVLMGHRRGDSNPRHNLQDHRMFDDVTGMFFFLGFFWALAHSWKRKYFWALAGLGVMSLPCILSTDPAHASRMVGTTPFSAFLAASAVGAVWGWVRRIAGGWGEKLFVLLLLFPLYQMTVQNYHTYFVEQARNYASWREYSTEESIIGKAIAAEKDRYEYFVDPKFYGHFTVSFFTYFQREHVHPMIIPESAAPWSIPPGRGIFFAIEMDRTGVLEWLKTLYPQGKPETVLDPQGRPIAHFFKVEATEVARFVGPRLTRPGRAEINLPEFPYGIPPGPYRGELTGSFWAEATGGYRFTWSDPSVVSMSLDGKNVVSDETIQLDRGLREMRLVTDVGAHPAELRIQVTVPSGRSTLLTAQNLSAIRVDRGWNGAYYPNAAWTGAPSLRILEPVLNFSNGNQLPIQLNPVTARWRARLRAPATGEYQFINRTTDEGAVRVDGRSVAPLGPNSQGAIHLVKGNIYDVEVSYRKAGGFWANYVLQWKRPDRRVVEVLPNDVLVP